MKYTIPVITLTQEDGAGGFNVSAYNTKEELLADHYEVQQAIKKGVTEEELAKVKKDILDEDDPYENGYLGKGTIDIEVGDNGVTRLSKAFSFHAGQ